MPETGGAGLNGDGVWEFNLFWGPDFSEPAKSQLAHFGFTPTVHTSIACYSQGVVAACSDVSHLLAMEVLNIRRHGSHLNRL